MNILNFIDKDELKRLGEKSDAMAAWVTFANFALIALGFAIPIYWHSWLAWPLAAILLAGRALGLSILVHDTAHKAFFASRALNEWAGRWVFGGLPNVVYYAFRDGHLAHHRHAGTAEDADLAFVDTYPASAASLLRKMLRDVSGINGVKNLIYQARSFTLQGQAPFLLSHALLFAILWASGHAEVYWCWWLGQLFVFPLLARLRIMGEHGGVPNHFSKDARENTGTTLAGPLARLLWAPNYVNFHLEHHFAPAVPPYRLAQLHRSMKAKGFYEGRECIKSSYLEVIKRCWTQTSTGHRPSDKRVARGILDNMR